MAEGLATSQGDLPADPSAMPAAVPQLVSKGPLLSGGTGVAAREQRAAALDAWRRASSSSATRSASVRRSPIWTSSSCMAR